MPRDLDSEQPTHITAERGEVLYERSLAGASLGDLTSFAGLHSPEGVRYRVQRTHGRHLDKLELDLMTGEKSGDWPTLLVPFQEQSGCQAALSHLQDMVSGLHQRGLTVHAVTRQTPDGSAFMLTTKEGR
jgi:hypothetical protein